MHIVEKSVDTFDNLSTKVLRPHPANYSIHNKKKKMSGIFLSVSPTINNPEFC